MTYIEIDMHGIVIGIECIYNYLYLYIYLYSKYKNMYHIEITEYRTYNICTIIYIYIIYIQHIN